MTSLTLAIPAVLKKKMDEHPDINWSEVARQSIANKIVLLEKMNRLLSHSKLTESDAIELGAKVSRGMAKRLLEK